MKTKTDYNNFNETDGVVKDSSVRDTHNWKPKYWILYYPLDYLMFIILRWYEHRLWKLWLQFDCSEKNIESCSSSL